jgi:hypothetical protein
VVYWLWQTGSVKKGVGLNHKIVHIKHLIESKHDLSIRKNQPCTGKYAML